MHPSPAPQALRFDNLKDALELYEQGKHRRYGLLFAVNGGAFAVARLLAETAATAGSGIVLGQLTLSQLGIGMALFSAVMTFDIFSFGRRMRQASGGAVFGWPGKAVLLAIGLLLCLGWVRVAGGG